MYRIIERINRHIPTRIRRNKIAYGLLLFVYKILIGFDEDFKSQIDSAIGAYQDKNLDKKSLYNDMLHEFICFWVRPMEYTRFVFYGKPEKERREYIPDFEEISIFKWTNGNNILPDSKFERYNMFREFFLRSVLCVDLKQPTECEYKSFISRTSQVIIKPLKGTKGHGVRMLMTSEIPSLDTLKNEYSTGCLLEEAIDQGDELKQFHPNSVNTVRFVTGMDHCGVFHPVFALLRVGRGGSIVDNVSSGGLVALIDMETGRICTNAYCGAIEYMFHPDTSVCFKGFEIPAWKELCSIVKKIHIKEKQQRIFGFDMAWTRRGWDLVEVNPAPSFDSFQELTHKGIRPYLRDLDLL